MRHHLLRYIRDNPDKETEIVKDVEDGEGRSIRRLIENVKNWILSNMAVMKKKEVLILKPKVA